MLYYGTQGLLVLLFLLILYTSFRRRLRISQYFNGFPAGTTDYGINPSLSSHHSAATCGYRGFSTEYRDIRRRRRIDMKAMRRTTRITSAVSSIRRSSAINAGGGGVYLQEDKTTTQSENTQ